MQIKSSLAFAAITLFYSTSLYAAEPSAKVLTSEGDVQARASSYASWQPLKAQETIGVGAEVLVGKDSSCELALGENKKSVIRIKENSKAVLQTLDPVKIDLKSGKIFALVRNLKPGSTFMVNSPTAIASARGTGWGQDENSISVFEDNVHVEGSSGEEMDVKENQGINIDDSGDLGEAFELPQEALQEWSSFEDAAEEQTQSGSEKDGGSSQSGSESGGGEGSGEGESDILEQEPAGSGVEEAMLEGKELSDEAGDEEEIDEEDDDDGHGGGPY